MGLALGLLLAPPTERAEPEIQRPGDPVPWVLDWRAPASSCPDREQLVEDIRSYLPQLDPPPLEAARAELRITAEVGVEGEQWRARLRLDGPEGRGERSFGAEDCKALTKAVALVSAVALDPVVAAEEIRQQRERLDTQPESEPEPEPELPAEPAPLLELEAQPEREAGPQLGLLGTGSRPPDPRPFQIGVRVAGGGGYGPTTTGYGSLTASVSLFASRWRGSLDGGVWLPRTVQAQGAGGRFWGAWGGMRGCWVPELRAGAVELPLCGGLELGQIRAQGQLPAVNPRAATQLWLAASLGAGLNWVLSRRVALSLELTGQVPLLRGSFSVGDAQVQGTAPVAVRAAAGVELRF